MTESLLSFSEVLLFGRVMGDLSVDTGFVNVRLATTANIDISDPQQTVDGVEVEEGDLILVKENPKNQNGIYVADAAKNLSYAVYVPENGQVAVDFGNTFTDTEWRQTDADRTDQTFDEIDDKAQKKKKKGGRAKGRNQLLRSQYSPDAKLARIYGFAYEGTYYELPEPVIFLVHGPGETAAADSGAMARSPKSPSESGVASADYQVADDIMYWPYDKADYTVRMDVMSGQFEQVLLDIYFGFDSPAISGAKVSGAKVSGAKVSGAKVSGAKVSGAKVSGAKVRGGD